MTEVRSGLPSRHRAPGPSRGSRLLQQNHHAAVPRQRRGGEEPFRRGQGVRADGRYDKAYQDYDKILNLDPYNIAARKGQEEVNRYRDQYANQAYEETRSQLLWQLDNGWQMPVHKFGVKGTENFNPTTTDVRHTEYITSKLNRIIIPKIEFRDATVREAVDFLKEKSRDLDTQEPDPTRRGVNIVLQLDSGEAFRARRPAPAAPAAPAPRAAFPVWKPLPRPLARVPAAAPAPARCTVGRQRGRRGSPFRSANSADRSAQVHLPACQLSS